MCYKPENFSDKEDWAKVVTLFMKSLFRLKVITDETMAERVVLLHLSDIRYRAYFDIVLEDESIRPR